MNCLKWCSLVMLALITSCGGGGGGSKGGGTNTDGGGVSASGSGYSIALDKSAINFEVLTDGPRPEQVVSVTFKGDGVIVGYPPGVPAPLWLNAVAGPVNGNKVDITLTPINISTAIEGMHSTTLRFVTGKSDGSVAKYVDIPVTINVLRPYLISIASPSFQLKYTSIDGNALPAAQNIMVTANRLPLNWSLAVEYGSPDDTGWLSVAESGSFDTKSNVVPVSVKKASIGVHKAKLLFTDSTKVTTYTVPIEFTVSPAVQVTGLSNIKITNTSTLADLSKTLDLSSLSEESKKAALTWTLTSDKDWVNFDVTSGNFSKTNAIKMQLDPKKMKNLPFGDTTVHVKVAVGGGDISPADFSFVVSNELPSITTMHPYVGYAGRSESITLYGGGFSKLTNPKIMFGSTEMDATVENDRIMHVKYPADLTAGTVNMVLKSDQIIPAGTSLSVVNAPKYVYAKETFPGSYTNIDFDPERGSIILSNTAGSDIRKLSQVSGSWVSKTYAGSEVNPPALTLDGKDLVTTEGFWSFSTKLVYLDPVTLEVKSSKSLTSSSFALDSVSQLFDGNFLMIGTNQWPQAMMYPSQQMFTIPNVYSPVVVQSADKSLILMGAVNDAFSNYSLSAGETSFTQRTLQLTFFRKNTVVVSRDANRIVAEGNVYDKTFKSLGAMAKSPMYVAISPDGKSVYGYDYSDNGQGFSRFDISGAAGPYPQASSNLNFSVDSAVGFYVSAMKVTDDGNALIVVTSKRDNNDFFKFDSQLYVFPLN